MHFTLRTLLGISLIISCYGNRHFNEVGDGKHHHHHHSHHKSASQRRHQKISIKDSVSPDRYVNYNSVPSGDTIGHTGKDGNEKQEEPKNSAEIRGVYFVVKLDDSPPTKEELATMKERKDDGRGGTLIRRKRYRRNTESDDGGYQDYPIITEMHIKAVIVNRFSNTKITSSVSNTDTLDQEATFEVQIPEKAFISNFTMLINGELFIAEVREKEEAEKEYEKAKERNETAGKISSTDRRVSQPSRGMEVFSVAVNVAAQSKIEFSITYQQLLERKLGSFTQLISVRPGQIIQVFSIKASIHESQGITFVNVSLNNTALHDRNYEIMGDSTSREIDFSPSAEFQRGMDPKKGINADLKITYDVTHNPNDAGLICVDGEHFIHYFSPSGLDPLNKHIVFVIDVSGSMAGEKIEQTLIAMWSILDTLRPNDRFQLILFDDKLRFWPAQQDLITASTEYVVSAKKFLGRELKAQGSTNINDALLEACRTLSMQGQFGSNMIIFLTDGQPTAGETDPDKIVNNVVEAAGNKVSVFSLGFGNKHELDFDLLKKISYRTGVAEGAVRIYPGIEADDQLRNFFKLVNTPLLYDIKIQYPVDVVIIDSVTQKDYPVYFEGSELVVAGKIDPNSVLNQKTTKMDVYVKGVTTMEVQFEKTVDFSITCPKVSQGYIQRLYAYMMIKHLLIQEMKTDIKSTQDDIRQDALKLALDNHLVTPLTSMIITQQGQSMNTFEQEYDSKIQLFASSMGGRSSGNDALQSNLFIFGLLICACLTTL